MTSPTGGFEIAVGKVRVVAEFDRPQMNRTANEAGESAGTTAGSSFSRKFTERLRNSSGQFVSAGTEAGDSFHDGMDSTSKKRSKSFFSRIFSMAGKSGDDSGDNFGSGFTDKAGVALKAVSGQMSAVLLPAAVALGPLLGASLGAGIVSGLGLGAIAAGVFFASKDDDVKAAGKKFRNTIFGMSEEDKKELVKDYESAQNKLTRLMLKQSRQGPAKTEAQKRAQQNTKEDIKAQKQTIKEMETELDQADNFMFARATKAFRGPLISGLEAATKLFLKLEPTFTKIFQAVLPGLKLIAGGLVAGFVKFLPAFGTLMDNMTPFFKIIGEGFERIGAALGRMLNKWTDDPEVLKGMQKALEDIFGLIETLINWFGDFVVSTSKAYAQFKEVWAAIANWFSGTIVPSLKEALDQLKAVFWAVVHWFSGPFKDFFVSAWNGIASWFGGIPKWFKDRWQWIKNTFSSFTTWLKDVWKSVFVDNFNAVKTWFAGIPDWFKSKWATIKENFTNAVESIKNSVTTKFNTLKSNIKTSIDGVKGFFDGLKTKAYDIFDRVKTKATEFKNSIVRAFQLARDGIGTAWNAIKDKVKGPVNFVIDPVYKNLREMWNKASSVIPGVGNLPNVKKFAKGGIAPGSGSRDTVPAMLTPGEGILTKKEMQKIGGPKGFAQLRKEIQYFNDGGIVGGIKDWVGGKLKAGKDALLGVVRGGLYPPAKLLADKFIYPAINKMANSSFSKLPRLGAQSIVDKSLSWLKGDDKKNAGAIGGGGGSGMGYQKQMAVLRKAFPGLALLSGFRPGSRTLSGNRSYHASGRAVDVAPRMDVAKWINANYGRSTKELITPWNNLNLHNGKRHTYTGDVFAQHAGTGRFKGNAHDHWAMDDISQRPPGWFTGYNGTGKTETLVNADKIPEVLKPVNNNFATGAIQITVRDDNDLEQVKQFFRDMSSGYNSGILR